MDNVKSAGNRIISWICYTVLFSFIPLIAYFIVKEFFGYDGGNNKAIGEIVFACIMISTDSLRTIIHSKGSTRRGLWDILSTSSIITIMFPAFIYGGMLLDYKINAYNPIVIPVIFLSFCLITGVITKICEAEV